MKPKYTGSSKYDGRDKSNFTRDFQKDIRQTARLIQTDHDRQQGVQKIRIIEVRIQENMKITRTTPTKNTGQDQDQRVSQNQNL